MAKSSSMAERSTDYTEQAVSDLDQRAFVTFVSGRSGWRPFDSGEALMGRLKSRRTGGQVAGVAPEPKPSPESGGTGSATLDKKIGELLADAAFLGQLDVAAKAGQVALEEPVMPLLPDPDHDLIGV